MVLTIAAPSFHCSEICYLINRLPGSSEPLAILEKMKPGESRRVRLSNGWTDGENFLTVTAVGHIGGCNTGVLGSWGATTDIVGP